MPRLRFMVIEEGSVIGSGFADGGRTEYYQVNLETWVRRSARGDNDDI